MWSPLDGPAGLENWTRQNGKIDVLLVFAGATPGSQDLDDNRRLAQACLQTAAELGGPTCLVASSSAVYGPGDGKPFHEDDALAAVSEYGRSKSEMERVCLDWRHKGLNVSVLRIGNVAGADALLGQVVARAAATPIVLDRFEDGGGPVRSYICPATLARVLETLAAGSSPLPDRLNVAAPSPVAMSDLLDEARLTWSYRAAPPEALQHVTLDCGRLSALHKFDEAASDPAAIVRSWRLLAGV